MKSDTIRAVDEMHKNGYSCVLCDGNSMYTSRETGVKPLVGFIESDIDFTGFCASDKIVGKATAMLYVILNVSEVYAEVMSEDGLQMLQKHGITAYYGTLVGEIQNRMKNDICPMDKAVGGLTEPAEGLTAIKNKMAEMNIK